MNSPAPPDARSSESAFRRTLLLLIGVAGIAGGLLLPMLAEEESAQISGGGARVFGNSMLRIGIVMLALWLALPTLRNPLRWIPPGLAVFCLLMIGACAAQPRLILIIAPAVAFVFSMRWIVKFFR